MKIPEGDIAFQKAKMKGYYQRQQLLMAMAMVTNWTHAVDIGGHVGFMSNDMAKFFNKVFTFEPQSENYECLEENTPDNVITFNIALSNKSGEVSLHNPSPKNSGAWETINGEDVRKFPLDSFGMQNIGLIKIDVQGDEVKVLQGAKNTILESKPILLVECVLNDEIQIETVDYIKSLGAVPIVEFDKDYIFGWPHVDQ